MSDRDPLDGFRSTPLSEDEALMLDALRGHEIARAHVALADAILEFMDSPVGRFMMEKVDEAEGQFLDAAKQAGYITDEKFRFAHANYLAACQTMLWTGEVVREAEEMRVEFQHEQEETLSASDLREPTQYEESDDV